MIISHERAREIIQEEVRKKHKINEQEDPLPGTSPDAPATTQAVEFRRRRAGFAWIGWHGGPDFTENDRELLEAMQRVLIDSKRKYNRSMPGENQFQMVEATDGDPATILLQWEAWVDGVYAPMYERFGSGVGLPSPDSVHGDWSFSGAASSLGYLPGPAESDIIANQQFRSWKKFIANLGDPSSDSSLAYPYFNAIAEDLTEQAMSDEGLDPAEGCDMADKLASELQKYIVGQARFPLKRQAAQSERMLDGFTTDEDFKVLCQIFRGVLQSDATANTDLWQTRAFLAYYHMGRSGPWASAGMAALDVAGIGALGYRMVGGAAMRMAPRIGLGGGGSTTATRALGSVFTSDDLARTILQVGAGADIGSRASRGGAALMSMMKTGGSRSAFMFRRAILGQAVLAGQEAIPLVRGRIFGLIALTAAHKGQRMGLAYIDEIFNVLVECHGDEMGNLFLGMLSPESAQTFLTDVSQQYDPNPPILPRSKTGEALHKSLKFLLAQIRDGGVANGAQGLQKWEDKIYEVAKEGDIAEITWDSIMHYQPGIGSGAALRGRHPADVLLDVGGDTARRFGDWLDSDDDATTDQQQESRQVTLRRTISQIIKNNIDDSPHIKKKIVSEQWGPNNPDLASSPTCPVGTTWNPATGECEEDSDPPDVEHGPAEAPTPGPAPPQPQPQPQPEAESEEDAEEQAIPDKCRPLSARYRPMRGVKYTTTEDGPKNYYLYFIDGSLAVVRGYQVGTDIGESLRNAGGFDWFRIGEHGWQPLMNEMIQQIKNRNLCSDGILAQTPEEMDLPWAGRGTRVPEVALPDYSDEQIVAWLVAEKGFPESQARDISQSRARITVIQQMQRAGVELLSPAGEGAEEVDQPSRQADIEQRVAAIEEEQPTGRVRERNRGKVHTWKIPPDRRPSFTFPGFDGQAEIHKIKLASSSPFNPATATFSRGRPHIRVWFDKRPGQIGGRPLAGNPIVPNHPLHRQGRGDLISFIKTNWPSDMNESPDIDSVRDAVKRMIISELITTGGTMMGKKTYWGELDVGDSPKSSAEEAAAELLKPFPDGLGVQTGSTKNPATEQVQILLEKLDYDIGSTGTDGIFGELTRLAVEKFQQDEKLQGVNLGVVAEKTLIALIAKAREVAAAERESQEEQPETAEEPVESEA